MLTNKQQDEIVHRKLKVTPLHFESEGREMMYCYPDSGYELAGWLLYRHAEGHWVMYRKATDEDIRALSKAVVESHHSEESDE